MAGVTATAKQRRQQQRASVIHELRDVAYYCTQLDPTHTRNHVSPFARAIVWHNHDDDVSILYNYIKYIIFLPISLAANFYFSILIRRVLFAPIYLHIGRRGGTENHVNLFGVFFFWFFSPVSTDVLRSILRSRRIHRSGTPTREIRRQSVRD